MIENKQLQMLVKNYKIEMIKGKISILKRTYILDRIEEAKSLLLNNIDRIARWAVESE